MIVSFTLPAGLTQSINHLRKNRDELKRFLRKNENLRENEPLDLERHSFLYLAVRILESVEPGSWEIKKKDGKFASLDDIFENEGEVEDCNDWEIARVSSVVYEEENEEESLFLKKLSLEAYKFVLVEASKKIYKLTFGKEETEGNSCCEVTNILVKPW